MTATSQNPCQQIHTDENASITLSTRSEVTEKAMQKREVLNGGFFYWIATSLVDLIMVRVANNR